MENGHDNRDAMTALLFLIYLQDCRPPPLSGFIDFLRRHFAAKRVARMQRFLRRQQESRQAFGALLASYSSRPTKRTVWVRQRSGAWWEHIVTNWTEYEWELNFRMRKTTFRQLCEILRRHIQRRRTSFRKPVIVEQRVAICVWRLATNVEFRTISHLFGIGQSTAVTIANEVASVIVQKMLPLYIKTPTEDEFRVIIQGFRDRWGFPQCGGAIDSTHIGILAPAVSPADYYNCKGFYSVILQGVVDHRLRFWDINVGWPGKVHDATVFGNSSLHDRAQGGSLFPHLSEPFGGVNVPVTILGDAAYPLLPWLMKPYPETADITPAQLTYNNHLNRARMAVKRAFGRLKGRWQCLMKRNDSNIHNINTVISACCVLHNFCEDNSENFDGVEVQEDVFQGQDYNSVSATPTAHTTRDALCAYFASL